MCGLGDPDRAVIDKTAMRHTSEEFALLEQIVRTQPRERGIHIIADNSSAHKTAKVMAFAASNSAVGTTASDSVGMNAALLTIAAACQCT